MRSIIVRVEDTETGTAEEHVFDRSPVRIGRSAHNDLCLPRRFVSAWHGFVAFDERGARYSDLGSTNGSLLDGVPVAPRSAAALGHDSEVTVGSLRFTFALQEGAGPPVEAAGSAGPRVRASAARPHPEPLLAPGGITAMMKRLAAAPTDDFELAWRRVLVPGAVIGRFELIREVGRGSFGIVFEARDQKLGRLVAFKAVKPGRESQVMFRQELLQREAEAAAQLNHPNIVSLHDAGTCESGPYLIMELLHGESLRDRMHRSRLALTDALEVAIEMAWALDHAHAAGVVHRDLKPANVFLCKDGHVKVLDFGIALVCGAGARNAVGTPAYMAPEQWRLGAQDARTDVFGAAATLAESVTGELPYRVTEDWSAVLEEGARPHLNPRKLPPSLGVLLRRGLSPNPTARPKDGHAWLAELLEIRELLDEGQPAHAARPRHRLATTARAAEPGRAEPRAARALLPLYVAAGAALMAFAAVVYFFLR
ncbi:MAG TPA: FHA domain-containing serine/threonine-protein kinase [Anaeromyxobacteraceae bacterium]|nr:FHA domain-containing serine/threonine-protein kinase [Anaeromyxobacteraceae bacterium]